MKVGINISPLEPIMMGVWSFTARYSTVGVCVWQIDIWQFGVPVKEWAEGCSDESIAVGDNDNDGLVVFVDICIPPPHTQQLSWAT